MKKVLILLFMTLSIQSYSQSNNSLYGESTVYINMTLESVIEFLEQPQYVKVANTEVIYLSFSDRIIKLYPGIHRLKIDISIDTKMTVLEAAHVDLTLQSSYSRVIKNGQEDIDPLTGGITIKDYVEYTVCNFILGGN
jgi:hypothetical protein